MSTTYLVTGGAGYIGSHTVRALGSQGFEPVTLDNLTEGHREAVLQGALETGDLSDESFLDGLFQRYRFEGVVHFASRCYVGESVENPRLYYGQNVGNAMTLFRVMLRHGVRQFVLSSSCATYGDPIRVPIDETHPQDPVNPYGETKFFIERILRQYDRAYGLRFVALRYFNAAGASLDGQLGEAHDPETHLIPRILEVGRQGSGEVQIFGDDYPTPDGTCIRDYIHVLDLASAHIAALAWLGDGRPSEFVNVGTGHGYSVRQVIAAAVKATGKDIPARVLPRRAGDPPALVADAAKARHLFGWEPQHSDLDTIMQTAWNWEKNRRY